MSIKSLTILNREGDVLIHRNFVGTLTENQVDLIQNIVVNADFKPVYHSQVHNLIVIHGYINTLHIFLTCSAQADVIAAQYFLKQLVQVMKAFIPGLFDTKSLHGKLLNILLNETDLVLKNQVLIQELLEEMVDNGEIVTTDVQVLKLFIQSGQPTIQKLNNEQVTIQATKQSSYRAPNLKYRDNTISLSIVETLNCSVSASGAILETTSQGYCEVDSHLSGMPDCSVMLNDKVSGAGLFREGNQKKVAGVSGSIALDDIKFHHCVRQMVDSRGVNMKSINFIPPDGKFQLLTFQITQGVSTPFKTNIMSVFVNEHTLQVNVKLRANFTQEIKGKKVLLKIPAPPGTISIDVLPSTGSCKLNKEGTFAEWRMLSIQGGTEADLCIQFNSEQRIRNWRKPCCALHFEVPNYTASGLSVVGVQVVESSGYEVKKSFIQKTIAGTYQLHW